MSSAKGSSFQNVPIFHLPGKYHIKQKGEQWTEWMTRHYYKIPFAEVSESLFPSLELSRNQGEV